jgi:hypothetical protein
VVETAGTGEIDMRNPTLFAALTLVLAGPALAQEIATPAPTPPPAAERGVPTLSSVDRDGNGSVSRIEAARSKQLVRHFESLDQNRDGQLDKGEFARLETETLRGSDASDGPAQAPGQPHTPVKPEAN